ncbi:MAG TPA: YfhO family protein, partial [Candidatus Avimonas sp.]|nr:YfhO family protein [Candidatus Avimonas sp.]
MESSTLQKPRERTGMAFLLGLLVALAMFLPFLIIDRGYFIYYGDFNAQQIPFYKLAHDAVRSGNIFWSWNTDLGANFIGSYTFYLLGSPFFWLTLIFPNSVVPFLMAPLLILKFALASLTAYLYLRRFLKPDFALLGGLLYAFSGFSIYNIFFNHFHEAIVIFPLMLLSMELYMKEGKRGLFAVTVFLGALFNYYFFVGQAVFLMIYWFIKAFSKEWEKPVSRFFGLLFEAVVGTAMAGIILLPSFYSVGQNSRANSFLMGWNLLIYNKPQRFFDIIHSFFFPQDIPSRAVFFPDSNNKWASMSAWIPIFGCTGVFGYMQSRRHTDWVKRLILVLVIMALIPGLNAVFYLLNSLYYARWYYMMVLILVLATMHAIQDGDDIPVNWRRAYFWTGGITAAFTVFVGFVPERFKPDPETGKRVFGLYDHEFTELFWVAVSIAIVTLILSALLIALHLREREQFFKWSVGVCAAVILIFGWYNIGVGKVQGRFTPAYIIDRALGAEGKIELPDSGFYRVDFNNDLDNMGMYWKMPTIQAFHSIVPGSVMDFYKSVGVSRDVASRPENSHYALRGLLSVKWLFDYANDDNKMSKSESAYFSKSTGDETTYQMPGWSYYGEQQGYFIYQNDYFIPMGFTYDSYMTKTEYDSLEQSERERVLLKAIVVEDKDAEKYGKYLKHYEYEGLYSYNPEEEYFSDCLARKETAAYSFSYDNRGFTARINLPSDNLVFFSVPYESGWSATVNGKEAEIVKVNVGFMAVLCPAGDVTIRFNYMTPGLMAGAMISIAALIVFALYLAIVILLNRRRAKLKETVFSIPDALTGEKADQNSDLDFDLYSLYPKTEENPQD